jgi:hypothetical protein
LEFFIVRAHWRMVGGWDLHWDVGHWGIAFMREHAVTIEVLHESVLTEAAIDALEGAGLGCFRIGTIWHACRPTLDEFGIQAAFLINRKSRDGNSEPEGGNAEQQRESKARVHR